jgi:hypothetical protein
LLIEPHFVEKLTWKDFSHYAEKCRILSKAGNWVEIMARVVVSFNFQSRK